MQSIWWIGERLIVSRQCRFDRQHITFIYRVTSFFNMAKRWSGCLKYHLVVLYVLVGRYFQFQ